MCLLNLVDYSTDQNTDIFSSELRESIRGTIDFGEKCVLRFQQVEQELSREKAHLLLTVGNEPHKIEQMQAKINDTIKSNLSSDDVIGITRFWKFGLKFI